MQFVQVLAGELSVQLQIHVKLPALLGLTRMSVQEHVILVIQPVQPVQRRATINA